MTGLIIENKVVDTHDFNEQGHIEIFNAKITDPTPGCKIQLRIKNNTVLVHTVSSTDGELSYALPYTFLLHKDGYWIQGSVIVTDPDGDVATYPFATKIIGMKELRINDSGKHISMAMDLANPTLRGLVQDVAEDVPIRAWLPDQTLDALWSGVTGLDLGYASITGSTENGYQHTRDVSDIIKSRMVNCVDATLLFMTVFRICGMKPVYISLPGHAMPGILLSVDDDMIAKTVHSRFVIEATHGGRKVRVLPVEGTMACSPGPSRLADAIERGSEEMTASKFNLTIPSLDRIPLMCRNESKVVV